MWKKLKLKIKYLKNKFKKRCYGVHVLDKKTGSSRLNLLPAIRGTNKGESSGFSSSPSQHCPPETSYLAK